jgi:hypothetical protein
MLHEQPPSKSTKPATADTEKDAPKASPFRRRPWKSAPALTMEEIQAAVDPTAYPPLLNVHQAASLLQMSHHTVYKLAGDKRFAGATARGKPLRFWRDRLLQLFFNR